TDAGATWAMLPVNFSNVSKIMFDNAGRVYAATNNDLRRSSDGGLSWPTQLAGNIQDFEIAANGDLFATRNGDGIYRFQTGGTMWTKLTSILPTSNFGRIEVATAPSNANVLYAVFQKSTNPNANTALGLFESTDGGTTWVARSVPGNFGSQAWYDLIMAVDPNNSSRVWAGGVGMSVSGDEGQNWTGVGLHSDHHGIVYRPGSSDEMVFGNDGGVYRCTDGSAAAPSLTDKNNTYNVTQFLSTALHPTAGDNYILGGTQDNGTQRFSAAGINSTSQPSGAGGDGGFSFIDQDNASVQIAAYVNRLFFVSTDGGANFSDLTTTNAPSLFITPAEYDDVSNVFYYSSNADTLGRRANVGAGGSETFERITAFGGGQASALQVSPNTANRLFVGTENGNFVRIDNADQPGAITVTALTSPRAAYISCIVVEPGNDNHLLATCSNYGNAGQIFESTDGGSNWVNLTNDFPDMPVRWAMFHPFDPDQVLLATELGVWSTDDLDGLNTRWWPTSNFGLANVRVDMLQYRPSDHLVAAATHGRGMFTTDYFTLLNTCVPNLNISGSVAAGIYMAQDFITSDGVIAPARKVIYHAGSYIQLQPGFHAQAGSDFWAIIEPCGIGPKPADAQQNPPGESATKTRNSSSTDDAFGPLAVRCYPNPTAYRLFVEYDLPTDGSY
ncbi:MAG: 3-coathanger stack domain-containing protein, partial [Saprospiraceae bacterium]